MNVTTSLFPLLFLVLFPVMWWGVAKYLAEKAGMSKQITGATGNLIRRSRWGSAKINGVQFKSCVKLAEYEHGLLLRTMWIFGGGQIWMPRSELTIGPLRKVGVFRQRSRDLEWGGRRLSLLDGLAGFVK